mmetsp:Transcript_814/g.1864  ORF Transcript_814/g.1864 Transcript_814/m.1864 type:complete len:234 (+) Transcript_814:285-986(+)
MIFVLRLGSKATPALNDPTKSNLRERLVVFFANLGTRLFDVAVETPTEGSTERRPGLNQNTTFVVFGNRITGMVGYTDGQLIDHRLDGCLFQDTIELPRRKVGNRYAFCQFLGVHLLESTPLAFNGFAIWSRIIKHDLIQVVYSTDTECFHIPFPTFRSRLLGALKTTGSVGDHRAANIQVFSWDVRIFDGLGKSLLVSGQDTGKEIPVPAFQSGKGQFVRSVVVVNLQAKGS